MERDGVTRAEAITAQYLEFNRELEKMFAALRPRTKYELWRYFPQSSYHMVGGCYDQDKDASEQECAELPEKT